MVWSISHSLSFLQFKFFFLVECVLLAHVHDGDAAVLSSDITEPTTVDSMSLGYELDIEPGDPLTVNGLAIDTPDIPAMNGVLHSLADGVLLPPCVTDDIVAILSARELSRNSLGATTRFHAKLFNTCAT